MGYPKNAVDFFGEVLSMITRVVLQCAAHRLCSNVLWKAASAIFPSKPASRAQWRPVQWSNDIHQQPHPASVQGPSPSPPPLPLPWPTTTNPWDDCCDQQHASVHIGISKLAAAADILLVQCCFLALIAANQHLQLTTSSQTTLI